MQAAALWLRLTWWQAAGQECPQGSAAAQGPPQLNSCLPHRLSADTRPQWQEALMVRGQGGPARNKIKSAASTAWESGRAGGNFRSSGRSVGGELARRRHEA